MNPFKLLWQSILVLIISIFLMRFDSWFFYIIGFILGMMAIAGIWHVLSRVGLSFIFYMWASRENKTTKKDESNKEDFIIWVFKIYQDFSEYDESDRQSIYSSILWRQMLEGFDKYNLNKDYFFEEIEKLEENENSQLINYQELRDGLLRKSESHR